jgi:predicted nucleic acid-binding protein
VILVDTSVWIDHLHRADPHLAALLERNDVSVHPMVIGELSLGSIAGRDTFLSLLSALPVVAEATHGEVLGFVATRRLHGRGLSLVDAHLLASAVLSKETLLWTRDQRLVGAAAELGLAWGGAADS